MTECERIIKDGILPESFFKPETICNFYVDEHRKKIWAVLIDLLVEFDRVCRKYKLKYFLAGGNLLGVIRHNGFIPWDDDIDVFMTRKEYDKLLCITRDEFKHPYFLQIPCQDGNYYFSFSKLRNCNTSGISKAFRYETFNQGLFLDIFPLDNFSEENAESNYRAISNLIDELSVNMRRHNKYPTPSDVERMAKYTIRDNNDIFRKMDTIARNDNYMDTDKLILAVSVMWTYQKLIVEKKDIEELEEINYYGHKTFIPKGYDKILRTQYGNYMEFPPIEDRGTHHDSVVFDPDVPYREKLQEIYAQDKLADNGITL